MSKVDLSDLISSTAPTSRAEALDLLGDLVGATDTTSLFGDKPVKLSKPRPTWHIDGALILTNRCHCRSCGNPVRDTNPKMLVSMSYVDHEGNVLKSVQTSDYALLLEVKGGPFAGKKTAPEALDPENYIKVVTHRSVTVEDVDFCHQCITKITCNDGLSDEHLRLIIHNQHTTALRKKETDTKASPVVKDRLSDDKAAAAEKALFDLVENHTFKGVDLDVTDDDLPY